MDLPRFFAEAATQRGGRTDWNLKAPWGGTRQDVTRIDDIRKSLANPPTGSHPAVLGPAKINEWLEAVSDVTKQKLAAGQ